MIFFLSPLTSIETKGGGISPVTCSVACRCWVLPTAHSPGSWKFLASVLCNGEWPVFVLQNSELINAIWCLLQPPFTLMAGFGHHHWAWYVVCWELFPSDFFNVLLIFMPPSCGPQKVNSVIWQRKCFPAILFKGCLKELIKGSITSQDCLQAMVVQVKDWLWLIPWQEACQNQLPFPAYKAISLAVSFWASHGSWAVLDTDARQFCSHCLVFLLLCVLGEWHVYILSLRVMVLGFIIWQAERDSCG